MLKIRLSEAARADLIEIWAQTFQKWGPNQADAYLDDIDRALNGLIDNPQMGSDCSDLLMGARRLITGRHVAFYEAAEIAILVIRVLHQSMDMPRHLRGR
jgi:toxin ParE1/3/4